MDNGSKPHAQPSSNIFDETGFSPDYHALKASMDAYVVWEGMPLQQRLEFIWNQLPKEQWLEDFYLPTLAEALPDAVQWARTTERYKDLFGSPKSLEAAVKQYLAAQQDTSDTSALEETTRARQRPVVVSMDTVQAESVEWLWWPYIAVGNLCMLVGDPGVGKSLLMTQLAASLSRGYPLPDQQGQPTLPTGGPHVTLLLCTEDGLANTIKPRLQAAGADCSQVKVLTGWLGPEDEEYAFTLLHMGVLEDAIQEHRPRLVVIDPIQAYLGDIDMNQANKTRPLLAALARLAERYRCAVVCVQHPSKGGGNGSGKAIYRGLGSIDFIGAARSGLFVEQHPVDVGKALLFQHKSNLGALGRPQVFSKSEGQFHWCGVTRLPVKLVAGEGRGPDPTAFIEAFCWLEQRLEGGLAWSASDIETEATDPEKTNIAKGTLFRAKQALGVVSAKGKSAEGGWTWRLPPLAHVPPPTTTVTSKSSNSTQSSNLAPDTAQARMDGQDFEVSEVTEENKEIEVTVVEGRERGDRTLPHAPAPEVRVPPPPPPTLLGSLGSLDSLGSLGSLGGLKENSGLEDIQRSPSANGTARAPRTPSTPSMPSGPSTPQVSSPPPPRAASLASKHVCLDCQQALEEVPGSHGRSLFCARCREIYDVVEDA